MSPSLLDTCQTLPEILARGAERHPEQVAFTFLDDLGEERARLTFGKLAAVVEDRARRLATRHQTGARLVLALPTGQDFLVLLLAAMRAGLIPVPAPVPRPSGLGIRRLDGIVRSSTASAVITTAALRASLCQSRVGSLGGLPLATPEEIGDIEETREPPPVGPGDVAFLQYSSGSTGAPKGIVNLHGTVLANERMLRDAQGHGEGLVAVSWLPLFHDMGLICYLLHTLCVGGHLVAMSPLTFLKRPVRWLQAISRYGAQSSGAPSSSFGFCVERIDEAERESLDLRTLSTLMVGAEPVRPEAIRRFLAAFAGSGLSPQAIFAAYGLAEATVFVSAHRSGKGLVTLDVNRDALARGVVLPQAADSVPVVSVGHPWHDLAVRIVDPETRCALGDRQVGEVWVAGGTVAAGYWDLPAATEETFRSFLACSGEGPFLRTGDLGFCHEGKLFITGRMKDLILIEGLNVYPQDVEEAIENSHPALRRGYCAAFGVDERETERIVAVAEVERSAMKAAGFEPRSILAAARAALANDHDLRLHRLVLVKPGTVSRTSSGKIQRGTCRSRYLAGELEHAQIV